MNPSKGLREKYPKVSLLRKSMKTGSELGIPSKICLLKDLTRTFRKDAGLSGIPMGIRLRGNSELSKS